MISETRHDVRIIRRPVKHARLRVREDTSVELVVPADFGPGEIEAILRKKELWIHRHQAFFRAHPRSTPELWNGELLLFGERFRMVRDPSLRRRVVVDRPQRLVRSKTGLADNAKRDRWFRVFARSYLTDRVEELSRKHGFRYGRLFVRSQRTRWGSCSAKRNISLNRRLITAPTYVIDYVIVHELVHTRVMDHSQRFWVNLAAICPDHRRAVDWLQRNTPVANA